MRFTVDDSESHVLKTQAKNICSKLANNVSPNPTINDRSDVCSWQVNQENVVKVGHRQVVNMIRQGGNRLLIKVVTVSRNLDPEDTARKKGTTPSNYTVHISTHPEPK